MYMHIFWPKMMAYCNDCFHKIHTGNFNPKVFGKIHHFRLTPIILARHKKCRGEWVKIGV